jgi:hypothetical protein
MIIKKHSEGSFVIINEHIGKIYCDAMTTEEGIHLVAEPGKGINVGKIFNLPGEYECGGVLIQAWPGKYYTFIFKLEGLNCGYFVGDVDETIIQDIAANYGQVEVACVKDVAPRTLEKLKQELKPTVWCSVNERVKIGEMKPQKTKELKISAKKLVPTFYLIE